MEAFVCGSPAHDNGSLAGSTTDSVSHLKACVYIAVVGLQQGGIGSTAFHIRTHTWNGKGHIERAVEHTLKCSGCQQESGKGTVN